MKRTASVLVLAGALLAGGGPAQAKVRVVTTMQVFRALAEEVGGDRVSATALVGDAVDPHHLDPRPSLALTLHRADLLVLVGLELERGWLPPLLDQSRNPKIQPGQPGYLDASTSGVDILDRGGSTSRARGDIHPLGNPHYWLPPDSALRVARDIADRLKAIDPAGARVYDERYADFARRVEARRKEWKERADRLAGVKVITYHKSWSYFTRWLGLEEIGYIEPKPGIPPDPAHLAALVKAARAQGVRFVIVEAFYPRNTAQRVAELAGARLVVLPADCTVFARSYFQLVDYLLAQLK